MTLVPDDPAQATSDHGWDFAGQGNFLRSVVQRLQTPERRVSLFCDPDAGTRRALRRRRRPARGGSSSTPGPMAGRSSRPRPSAHLADLAETAAAAKSAGLEVNAGHDLTLENLPALVRVIPQLAEVSIGHGITADALIMGFPEAVRRYLKALGR